MILTAAAPPSAIVTVAALLAVPPLPDVAPPENADTVAVPDTPSENNFAVAWPFVVSADVGSRRPIVVVKVTSVPFCTGVPASSVTVAIRLIEPSLAGEADA